MMTRLDSIAFNPVAQTVTTATVFGRFFPIISSSPASASASGLVGVVSSAVADCTCESTGRGSRGYSVSVHVVTPIFIVGWNAKNYTRAVRWRVLLL